MTIKEFTNQLGQLGVPYQERRGQVDIHDDDITPETASKLRKIGFSQNGRTYLEVHDHEIHNVYSAGLYALAAIHNIKMTSWFPEFYFVENEDDIS